MPDEDDWEDVEITETYDDGDDIIIPPIPYHDSQEFHHSFDDSPEDNSPHDIIGEDVNHHPNCGHRSTGTVTQEPTSQLVNSTSTGTTLYATLKAVRITYFLSL